jgi:hypothetical protein
VNWTGGLAAQITKLLTFCAISTEHKALEYYANAVGIPNI